MLNMQLPALPEGNDPAEIKQYLQSQQNWQKNMTLTGLQVVMLDQAQLDALTAENNLANTGKLYYNTDDDTYYRTKKSGSTLVVEAW